MKEFRNILSALFLILLIISPGLTAKAQNCQEADNLVADSMLYYQRLILQPELVGFTPSREIFESSATLIREHFFGDIPEDRLQDGCEKELRKLLRAAKITDFPELREGRLRSGFVEEALEKTKGRVDSKLLLYALLQGLFESLDDPYSSILNPRLFTSLREDLQSEEYGGIGAVIEPGLDKEITFVEINEGGPAYGAGLRPGDILLEINGTSVSALYFDEISNMLRGESQSAIRLKVRDGSSGAAKDVAITREKLIVTSISYRSLENNLGYIQIKSFAESTSEELDKALKELGEKKITALILDVRNNGGGYVKACYDVCCRFLDNGQVISNILDRRGRKEVIKVQESKNVKLPLVLLVNGYSCSASEVTAAALKDNKAATLIGSRTFGKGSMQTVLPLPDGAAIKLTIYNFLSPRGSKIHKKGVEPDVPVSMSATRIGTSNDIQLEQAIKRLEKKT